MSSSRLSRSSCQPSPFLLILMRLGPTTIRPAIRRDSSSMSRNRCGSTRMTMSWPSAITPRRPIRRPRYITRSKEHTSEVQSLTNHVCRLLLEKKKTTNEKNSHFQVDLIDELERDQISNPGKHT